MAVNAEKRREIALRNLELGRHNEQHGFYRYLSLATSEWPAEMKSAYEARFSELMNLRHVDPELDAGILCQLCRFEVLLARVWKWIGERELIDEKGNHQRILNILAVYENALTRCYEKVGLTPEARKRLRIGKRTDDLAEILSQRTRKRRTDGR